MKTTGQSEEVRATLAQEEQSSDAGEEQLASTPDEQPEHTTEEESSSPASEAAEADNTEAAEVSEEDASPRKKRKKKAEPVDVQQISPRPSYWPIALAFSLIVAFVGLADSPIVLGIGVLMIIISVIGWGLERR
jgi:cobalamin biosynthesis protein CobT